MMVDAADVTGVGAGAFAEMVEANGVGGVTGERVEELFE